MRLWLIRPTGSEVLASSAEAFAAVGAVLDFLPPGFVVQVPLDGFAQTGFEGFFRRPAQFFLDFAGVNGVAVVMARAVGDEGDQVTVVGVLRYQFLEQVADGLYDFQVGLFVVAADVVGFTQLALLGNKNQGAGVVFHVEPVPDLLAVAVHRQRFARQSVENHQRDELFRKMVWPVIVAAVGDNHRQAESAAPGADEVVRAGFTGAVGAAGGIGGGFGKQVVRAFQVAIDFVGGDMMEAEAFRLGDIARFQAAPVFTGRFQQRVSADDIGLDKIGRAVDGAVYMAFGGQVHNDVRLCVRQYAVHLFGIGDVRLHKLVARVVGHAGQRVQITGVGELVQVDDRVLAVIDQLAYHGGANKAGAAGDQYGFTHVYCFPLCCSRLTIRLPAAVPESVQFGLRLCRVLLPVFFAGPECRCWCHSAAGF